MDPVLSVGLVTYNHEAYVAEAIRSVLDGTFADLELIVVDDGSSDGTPNVVAGFHDPRLVSIRQVNQGPSAATNAAIRAARGRYFGLMCGDDVCRPDRFVQQLAAAARGGDRLQFGSVGLIDERSQPIGPGHRVHGAFDLQPMSRAGIIRRFFTRDNFINGVTAFGPTQLWRSLPPYDPSLYQAQDFAMWIAAVKRCELELSPEQMIDYRLRDRDANLSAVTPQTAMRLDAEWHLILRRFFDGMPPDLFYAAFGEVIRRPDRQGSEFAPVQQAFLLFDSDDPRKRLLGVERLHELLADAPELLRDEFGFGPVQFAAALRNVDLLNEHTALTARLFLDCGEGFGESTVATAAVSPLAATWEMAFDLRPFPLAHAARWDPLTGRLARITLEVATLERPDGSTTNLDLATFDPPPGPDGWALPTLQPRIHLPLSEPATRLTLRGRWTFASLSELADLLDHQCQRADAATAHVAGLHQALAATQVDAAALRAELDSIKASRGYRVTQRLGRAWRAVRRA